MWIRMRNHWRRTTVTSKKGGEERWHQGRAWSREQVVHELAVQLVSWLLCIHSFYLHTLQSLTSLTLQSKQCSALSKVFCRAPPSLTSRLSCNLIKNAQPCLITPSFSMGHRVIRCNCVFLLKSPLSRTDCHSDSWFLKTPHLCFLFSVSRSI